MGVFSRASPSKLERAPEAPEYNVRLAEYEAKNKLTHFGPNFSQGPKQQEIFDRRQKGEVFHSGHPELRNRAHSYDATGQHRFSDPYEKRPVPWTAQMKAEHGRYKELGDGKRFHPFETVISPGKNVQFGRNSKPTDKDKKMIEAAQAAAITARHMANEAVQAREGFMHKYPQGYDSLVGIEEHTKEVIKSRNKSKNFQGDTTYPNSKSDRSLAETIVWKQREEREEAEKNHREEASV